MTFKKNKLRLCAFPPSVSSLPGNKFRHNLQIYIDLLCGFLKQVTVFWDIALGKNRLFKDWIMQEMVPHKGPSTPKLVSLTQVSCFTTMYVVK